MRRPNYFLAFLLAPVAGAVMAILLAFVASLAVSGDTWGKLGDLFGMALMVGSYALVICAVFTLVVGLLVVLYVRMLGRVPSLPAALLIGFVLSAGLFLFLASLSPAGSRVGSLGLAAYAGGCSLPTAWTFWWLGLRGRRIDE